MSSTRKPRVYFVLELYRESDYMHNNQEKLLWKCAEVFAEFSDKGARRYFRELVSKGRPRALLGSDSFYALEVDAPAERELSLEYYVRARSYLGLNDHHKASADLPRFQAADDEDAVLRFLCSHFFWNGCLSTWTLFRVKEGESEAVDTVANGLGPASGHQATKVHAAVFVRSN